MKSNGRSKGKKGRAGAGLRLVAAHAAGIDCGSRAHYVAVGADHGPEAVRRFGAVTPELHALAEWLKSCAIETVAMESTGVYWIALYEILEERGFEVVLVNAHHVKHVPGCKSDVQDCQWLQELHSFGLLRGSFRPSAEIVGLRAYLRHREKLVQNAGDHVRRMQKVLLEMNLQLHTVLSDITGLTGMRIIRDIVAGQTDPKVLAGYRHGRCQATEAEIEASLTGNYRPEHVFVLRQHLALFDAYQEQIGECDEALDSELKRLAAQQDDPSQALPKARTPYRAQGNAPRFDSRALLHQITGADLTQIDSIGSYTALRLVSEIGTDMSRWPTEKHFVSWMCLSPSNKVSGDRILSSRTRPSTNRAATQLRLCAVSVGRTQSALGAYYRRLAYRVGKAKAVTATARKLAILVYRVLRGDFNYRDPGAETYDAQHRARAVRSLRARAQRLGFNLFDAETGELLEPVVS